MCCCAVGAGGDYTEKIEPAGAGYVDGVQAQKLVEGGMSLSRNRQKDARRLM